MESKSKLELSQVEKEKAKSKCPVCKGAATFVCGACQVVSYCCVDHQKKHWKLHQSSCVFFHIKNDPSEFTGAGKYCVASRDLKAGTVILEEHPAFQMPSNDIHVRCITCGIDLPPIRERNASNSCPKCNWPVCGTACAELLLHATNECQVFVANKIPYPRVIAGSSLSELALYPIWMRAYAFMIQNPERWKELMEMLEWGNIGTRSLDEAIENFLYGDTFHMPALARASSHFPKITKEDESLVEGLLAKLMRLMQTQGYSILIQEASPVPGFDSSNIRQRIGAYAYKTARHFTHSCSPNCFWTVETFPDFKMQIRTSVSVKKGEKLAVSKYIYKLEFANGTRTRQKEFQTRFHLPCRCDLCLDPTEFGTNQSAVVCELCKADNDANSKPPGYLLPIDPLNVADDAPWKCNSCKKITIAYEFCGKIEKIFSDFINKICENVVSDDKVCEAFIEMHRNKLVHQNHWLIQLAGKFIRTYQLPRLQLMSVEELSGFEKLMYFLLDLKDKTVPGIIHERIVIVEILSEAISHRLLGPSVQGEFFKEFHKKPREDLVAILVDVQKCQQHQNESHLYHKHNPNIRRGQTVDRQMTTLRANMKCVEDFKTIILNRLAEIEAQRLRLGIN